jgi:hypothetical protein
MPAGLEFLNKHTIPILGTTLAMGKVIHSRRNHG